MVIGEYELVFFVGDYFAAKGSTSTGEAFSGPGASAVWDWGGQRRLPRAPALLTSAYSTYRGS